MAVPFGVVVFARHIISVEYIGNRLYAFALQVHIENSAYHLCFGFLNFELAVYITKSVGTV